MGEKEVFALRLENDTAEQVKEYVDEHGVNRSDVLRRAIEEYTEQLDRDDRGAPRSVSPLTILGVVAIAVAPTLLATGYTGLGALFGLAAAAYALLWVFGYDVVLERALATARDELREAGGVVAFFRFLASDHPIDEPTSVVERAARLDVVALGVGTAGATLGAPLLIADFFGVLTPLLDAIGPGGVLALAALLFAFVYVFALLVGVSAIAMLAIASAAGSDGVNTGDEEVSTDA